MADDHDRFLLRVLFQQTAEVGEGRTRTQRGLDLQLAFVTHLVAHQRSGLRGALQRARNNAIHLRLDRGQGAADVAALLDAFFIERALFVFLRISEGFAGAGVT